ncbi:MAG: dipeptide ABC transporter ATP-binding protein [Bdellovibrio sp.]
MSKLLEVKNLRTEFKTDQGPLCAVNGVSFRVERGRTLGLVGESGSGKSVTALSLMRLIHAPGQITSGQVLLNGEDLLKASDTRLREIRGNHMAMIFQEPMTSLNPVFTCGDQIEESIRLHRPQFSREQIKQQAIEILKKVGIPSPEKRYHDYPHQLSGGMRQRVMIGMAMSCSPQLLIADEPTTALDVTIQAQILDLMRTLQADFEAGMILITHDLGVVAEMCDDVAVMYAGKVVEQGTVEDIFYRPRHHYTKGLLNSIPHFEAGPRRLRLQAISGSVPHPLNLHQGCRGIKTPLLAVENLVKHFAIGGGWLGRETAAVQAVQGVSFELEKGETLGLVGESGCGKSTLGRCLVRLTDVTSGKITFKGQDITHLRGESLRKLRRQIQIIFQDPFASLNPRMTAGSLLEEPLAIHGLMPSPKDRRDRVHQLFETVGLRPDTLSRFPHEFSGGQRQRIGIARALAAEPELLICDEPVSALDVSIQAQVINLLLDLQQRFGLTYVFIAHDLKVVEHVSNRVAVMYLGQFVELAHAKDLYRHPQHPYTRALLSAIPVPDPHRTDERLILTGDVPSPLDPPKGCHFHPRCNMAIAECQHLAPRLELKRPRHWAACQRIAPE